MACGVASSPLMVAIDGLHQRLPPFLANQFQQGVQLGLQA